jgi:hypothetical protein
MRYENNPPHKKLGDCRGFQTPLLIIAGPPLSSQTLLAQTLVIGARRARLRSGIPYAKYQASLLQTVVQDQTRDFIFRQCNRRAGDL